MSVYQVNLDRIIVGNTTNKNQFCHLRKEQKVRKEKCLDFNSCLIYNS